MSAALDIGITEEDFYQMSVAEVTRRAESYKRQREAALKERAVYDYRLAQLIGCSFGDKFPSLSEAYPELFKEEKVINQNAINKARFLQFAAAHNLKYKDGEKKNGRITSSQDKA